LRPPYKTLKPLKERRDAHRESPTIGDFAPAKDGAFMEPSGRNRWQPVANHAAPKRAETRENRCRGLRPVADRLAWYGGGRRFESARGLCKSPANPLLSDQLTCTSLSVLWVWSHYGLPGSQALSRAPNPSISGPAYRFAMTSSPASVSAGTRIARMPHPQSRRVAARGPEAPRRRSAYGRGDLQVGRPLEHNDRTGGSLAEADGQRSRASVALGSPGVCVAVRQCARMSPGAAVTARWSA
jgi:hypothetical protein